MTSLIKRLGLGIALLVLASAILLATDQNLPSGPAANVRRVAFMQHASAFHGRSRYMPSGGEVVPAGAAAEPGAAKGRRGLEPIGKHLAVLHDQGPRGLPEDGHRPARGEH